MAGRKVLIHFNEMNELFDIDDFNATTVAELLKCAQHRFYGDLKDFFADPSDCLCEGPYAFKPLDDVRLRAIADMLQEIMTPDSINEGSEIVQKPIHLWFCNCANNGFLFNNPSTTDEQHHSGVAVPANASVLTKDIGSQSTYSQSSVPQEAGMDVDSDQDTPSQYEDDEWTEFDEAPATRSELRRTSSESSNISNGSSNKNVHKLIKGFRNGPKRQYRTDVFPSKKCKKAKKTKSTDTKTSSEATSKKRKSNKKYAFHLQGIKSKNQKEHGRYPLAQLPQSYLDLIQDGKTVSAYVAVVKRINDRLYLDPLKGFLIDKKNSKTPLENPCVVPTKWTDKNNVQLAYYPLKLALIQVSGDIQRKCNVEYNQNFNFAKRTVDEISKYSDYDTTDDVDDPEEFKIVVLLATGETQLKVDWLTLIESDEMHYVIPKSKEKQKTSTHGAASK